jgi:hypothetical protein
MAQKITVALQDDLDGGPADETVQFAIGGTGYEIDLSTSNAAAFRAQLAPFIACARKAGWGPRRQPGRSAASRERSGVSGRGRKTGGSRSASGGASPPASWISTKPPPHNRDPDRHRGPSGPTLAVPCRKGDLRRDRLPGTADLSRFPHGWAGLCWLPALVPMADDAYVPGVGSTGRVRAGGA